MDTISPDYAALNAELHQRAPEYGTGAWRKGEHVLELVMHEEYKTVLDYGCGKGALAADLRGVVDVAEYDPAIEGKDAEPQPADLVCCFDVLEHVEPERLTKTLIDLRRVTRGELFATISLIPSSQTLADGRNAHLIVRPQEWWREQFSPNDWRVVQWDIHDHEIWARLKPLYEIGDIKAKMAVSYAARHEHVLQNIARVSDRLTRLHQVKHEENDRRAILVCFGPSLQSTWPQVALDRFDEKTDVFTVSAAHKFMIERGVIPKAHIDCDPRPHKITQMGVAHPEVEYWLASCIHPDYIDHVAGGKRTALWHAYNGEDSCAVLDLEPGQRMIVGGGSVGLRSMSLLYHLGYRRFEIHGMDCSFYEKGKQWAGEHHGKIKDEIEVAFADGTTFLTAPALILYYRYFAKQVSYMLDADIKLHGDGMLQHKMRLQSNDQSGRGGQADIHPAAGNAV